MTLAANRAAGLQLPPPLLVLPDGFQRGHGPRRVQLFGLAEWEQVPIGFSHPKSARVPANSASRRALRGIVRPSPASVLLRPAGQDLL
jgi:hypothetical protein